MRVALVNVNFRPTEEEWIHCMLENWYPIFKEHTFETKFVSLPSEFVNYLLEDGIFVDSEVFPTPEKEYRYDMGEEWSDEEEVLFFSS